MAPLWSGPEGHSTILSRASLRVRAILAKTLSWTSILYPLNFAFIAKRLFSWLAASISRSLSGAPRPDVLQRSRRRLLKRQEKRRQQQRAELVKDLSFPIFAGMQGFHHRYRAEEFLELRQLDEENEEEPRYRYTDAFLNGNLLWSGNTKDSSRNPNTEDGRYLCSIEYDGALPGICVRELACEEDDWVRCTKVCEDECRNCYDDLFWDFVGFF